MDVFHGTAEERQRHRAWLAELKPGDQVAVCSNANRGETQYEKIAVKVVTPGGKIRMENGALFDKDGDRSRGEGCGRYMECLGPWTEDIDKLLARRVLLSKVCRYLDFSTVDRDKISAASDASLTALLDTLRTYRITRP